MLGFKKKIAYLRLKSDHCSHERYKDAILFSLLAAWIWKSLIVSHGILWSGHQVGKGSELMARGAGEGWATGQVGLG